MSPGQADGQEGEELLAVAVSSKADGEQLGVAAQRNERVSRHTWKDCQQQPGMQRHEFTGMLGSLFRRQRPSHRC